MNSIKTTLSVLVVLLILVSPSVGCKEGDTLISVSPATAEFAATPVTAGLTERYVTLEPSSIEAGRITLDIVLHEIDEPIAGVAIKLTYDPGFVRFIDCIDGNLLPPDGCLSSEPEPNSGEVFISRSITGISNATTVEGGRVIARLRFLVFGLDEAPIVFEGQNLGGGDASAVLDVDGQPILMQWFSGLLKGV